MKTQLIAALSIATATSALAHDGRRLEIQVINNQLWAQGYISAGQPDDGAGMVRPYLNTIHGHWSDNPSPVVAASATLPGFDLLAGGALTGFDIDLTIDGARKWVGPDAMPMPGTIPDLVASEEFFVSYGGDSISTTTGGTFDLLDNISAGGQLDIDLAYDIADEPRGVLYVIDMTLSTNAPGIAASEQIHIILSPDGLDPVERLHHASLYLESHLGRQVPAPASALTIGALALTARRRR